MNYIYAICWDPNIYVKFCNFIVACKVYIYFTAHPYSRLSTKLSFRQAYPVLTTESYALQESIH